VALSFGSVIFFIYLSRRLRAEITPQKSRLRHAHTPIKKICKGTNKNQYILIKINKVLNKKMLINNTKVIRFLQFLIFNQLFLLFRLNLN
jgi:hypothetical protein